MALRLGERAAGAEVERGMEDRLQLADQRLPTDVLPRGGGRFEVVRNLLG